MLTQASHKIAASVYQQASPSDVHPSGGGAERTWDPASPDSDDDVVDADYREVA